MYFWVRLFSIMVILFHWGSFVLFECVGFIAGVYFSLRELYIACCLGVFSFCGFCPCIINFVEEIFQNKCERYSKYNVIKNFICGKIEYGKGCYVAQWVMRMPIECEELGSLKIAFSRNLIYLTSFSSISFYSK